MSNESKYSIKDGAIFREDVKIATRDQATGTIDYLPDMARYRAPVTAWLKEQGMDKPPVTPPEVLARQAAPRVAGESMNVTETVAADVVTISQDAESVEQKRSRLQAELAALGEGPKPVKVIAPVPVPTNTLTKQQAGDDPLLQQYATEGAPAFDPMAADKTRAFVDWLYEKHPDHAEKRYSGRRTHRGLV